MKTFFRSTLPWILTVVFAAGFAVTALSRRSENKFVAKTKASAGPAAATPGAKKILYWVDPMHPAYKSDKPGTAPDCGMDLVPVYEDAATAGTASPAVPGYSTVSVSPAKQQAIGVRLGKAETRDVTKSIRTVGRVTFDETLQHQIHAKFEGYIEKLFVDYTGKPVRKGQPLLSIYSPDLVATQQEYLLAYRAKKQFSASSNPDVARGGVDLYESARQRLLLWDISPKEIQELETTGTPRKALTLSSPVDGFVLSKNAVAGARVMPADTLFEIADIRRVWVLADVYESEAPFVKVGQTAKVSLSYLPGRSWTGKVAFIAPVLDEKSRTVKVRLEIQNPDGTLKPEMYAEVLLERPLGQVVIVPEGAVLSTGTRAIAFIAKGDGRFEPREVKTGAKVNGWWEIRGGVSAGEDVVTQANFLIDSESRLKSALTVMSSPPSGESPKPKSTASSEHVH